MLSECFRPSFSYRKDALTAVQIWTNFVRGFRFLPDCTSQPDKLGKLIQRLIYRQRGLKIRMVCPRHDVPMVMLGKLGYTHTKLKNRNSMATLSQVGNGGGLFVANGLFRCPTPGCYFVAPLDDCSVTIRGAEVN